MEPGNNIVVLCLAERAYVIYAKAKGVTELVVWFKAELENQPVLRVIYGEHSDEILRKNTRHVESLANSWRKDRLNNQVVQVA